MALSLEIPIEDQTGVCELYEKIFAFDGGIYDRMTLEDGGYSDKIHFISYDNIKKEMHLISQNLAFAMFENSSLDLSKKEYTKIVKNISEDRLKDFAIANYYYITDYSLTFVHKSIYEYFLAEYIFNCINNAYITSNIEETLAFLFKRGKLSEDILYYFDYKIEKHNVEIYYSIESSINNMVKNGMTYFLENQIEDILKTESTIFRNLLYILNSYSKLLKPKQYKKINISKNLLYQLRNSFRCETKNLTKTCWVNVKISDGYYLQFLNLNDSVIVNSNFFSSNFTNTFFINVKIQKSNFISSIFDINLFQYTIISATRLYSHFTDCFFDHCTLKEVDFKDSEFNNVHFTNSTLKNINFYNTLIEYIDISGATLIDVDFSIADLVQYDTITIDEETSFENVTVDIEFVPIILKNTKKITNLIIVDNANDRKLTLEEYKELYSLN